MTFKSYEAYLAHGNVTCPHCREYTPEDELECTSCGEVIEEIEENFDEEPPFICHEPKHYAGL